MEMLLTYKDLDSAILPEKRKAEDIAIRSREVKAKEHSAQSKALALITQG